VPNDVILRAHVPHLAEPHLKARLDFEAAAEARGDDTTGTGARMEDALRGIIRRGAEQLAHGELDVAARDMIAAMRLQAQLDSARKGEGVEASQWQAAFMEFFEIVRRHLSAAQWRAFVTDVYASPAVRAVMEPAGELAGGSGRDGR
jgi:hypothetical protein